MSPLLTRAEVIAFLHEAMRDVAQDCPCAFCEQVRKDATRPVPWVRVYNGMVRIPA